MRITAAYATDVQVVCWTILRRVRETSAAYVKTECLNGTLRLRSRRGSRYRVSADGRTRWEGRTLAGALVVVLTEGLPVPQRIWHVHKGRRTLVLIYDGNDEMEVGR